MEGYLSTRSVAEEIYAKSTATYNKSLLEITKEEELVREALEISMAGLDNKNRQEVLSEINIRLEKGDNSFYDSKGVNFEKVKDITKVISLEVIKKQNAKVENEDNANIISKKEKNIQEIYEKMIQEKKDDLAGFCEDIPEDIVEEMARDSIQAEYDEKEIEVLIGQGYTEEEAINLHFKSDPIKIAIYKQTRRRDKAVEKAQKTGNIEDNENAKNECKVSEQIIIIRRKIYSLNLEKEGFQRDVSTLEEIILTTERALREGRGTEEDRIQLDDAKRQLDEVKKSLQKTEEEYENAKKQLIEISGQPIKKAEERTSEDEQLDFEIVKKTKSTEIQMGILNKKSFPTEHQDNTNQVEQANDVRYTIVKKIEDIGMVASLGHSKENIDSALTRMVNLFELEDIDEQNFTEKMLELASEDSMNKKIYEIIANVGLGVSIDDTEAVIEKLEKVREGLLRGQEHEDKSSNIVINGETNYQQLPDNVSSELQAIPIALQKINCSPEDIAKGMEAYSQMIGELTSEEINSDPQMLAEILNKAVKEIDLEGVAGDILQMMSQITFNGQISEILRNCKDVFLTTLNGPLLDPRVYAVNPDQNNTNPGTLSERVDEDALKAGFEALAVDLQVADQTIIRPEELVTEEAEHSVEEQEENTETSKKEDKKETREGTVLSKLQSFIGVYSNTEMSEVEEVGEEIINMGKEMGLILSNNPTINQEDIIIDESENDEDLTQ